MNARPGLPRPRDDPHDHPRLSAGRAPDRCVEQPAPGRNGRGLLRRRTDDRSLRAPDDPVRHPHDVLRLARRVGGVVPGRDRCVLPDGVVLGVDGAYRVLLRRHPGLGGRQPPGASDPGSVRSRPLGLRRGRPAAVRRPRRAAGPLPADRRDGRRHHAPADHRRRRAAVAGQLAHLRRRDRLRDQRRSARNGLGEHLPDRDVHGARRRHRDPDRHEAGRRRRGARPGGREPAGSADSRRRDRPAAAAQLHPDPVVGGHLSSHLLALALRPAGGDLQGPDRALPGVYRRGMDPERVVGRVREHRLSGARGAGVQLRPDSDDRPLHSRSARRVARRRRLRRDHVVARLTVALPGHDVHPGHRAPLPLGWRAQRVPPDSAGPAVRRGRGGGRFPRFPGR